MMRWLRNLLVAVLWSLPLPTHAQVAADSTLLRQLLDVGRPTSVQSNGRTEDRCTGLDRGVARVCEGLFFISRSELRLDPVDAAKARDVFEQLVGEQPKWALAWYGLGMARVQMARAGGFARQGPLHPVGLSNEAGAGFALVRALELDTTLLQAAEALAGLPVPREGRAVLATRVEMLRARKHLLSAQGLYSAAMVEMAGGSPDSALALLGEAKRRPGSDMGLVSLAIARAAHSAGMPLVGSEALIEGARFRSPAADAAYRNELAWVATPVELAAWDTLSAGEARASWLAGFWSSRDVLGGLRPGERLAEHYRRLEYASEHFVLSLPPSGRHRNSQNGLTIDHAENEVAERDVYALENEELRQLVIYRRLVGHESAFKAFRSSQTLLDDRGVIYVRHGQPTAIAKTTGGLAFEVWRYERESGPLILSFKEEDFDGQAGASVLVPTLINAAPVVKDQLCHLDPSLCTANADPRVSGGVLADARQISLSRREAVRREGVQQIAAATGTDFKARDFPRRIAPIVQVYGLTHGSDQEGRVVAVFAIPGDQLVHTTPADAGGRSVYAVRVELLTAPRGGKVRSDLDTLRRFATPRPLGVGEYLTGSIELPVSGGEHVVGVVLSQEDRGAILGMPRVTVCAAARKLCISDLVLGVEGSSVRWNSGGQVVPLNPLNAFRRTGSAELFYQVSGREPGARYETVVELFQATDTAQRKPALAIRFPEDASASRAEYSRSIGLADLKPGRYRLRMTTSGGGDSAAAVAWLTVQP